MDQKAANLEQRSLARRAPGLILRNAELEIELGRLRDCLAALHERNKELEGVIDLQRAKIRRYTNEQT